MNCFKNANVYIEGVGIRKTDLLFDGRTLGFSAGSDANVICLPEDAVVLPGFIDEHIHGAGGHDVMDGGDAVLKIAETIAAEGTCYFLATTMTASAEDTVTALRAISAYCGKRSNRGAGLLGAHLEGPFISPKHIGAQPAEYVAAPDVELFDGFYKASGGNIKMITLAPEVCGADKLIDRAKELGVTVSVGHTDATFGDVQRAAELGASCVTHTFNAQRGLHHREIGTAGAALLNDGLFAEVIADTVHVSVPALRLLTKSKPKDKVILITDAMRAKGMPDGESELGGQNVYVKNGEARLEDGTLAGSVLKMNTAVKNAVKYLNLSVTEAADLASANPAKNLGLFGELGGIKEGKRASYTVLDGNFDVIMTIIDGVPVYARQGGFYGKR